MAVGHLGRYVNMYREDGTWVELCCESDDAAAQLAHELSDFIAEMILRINIEEINEHLPVNCRIPREVRVAKRGQPNNSVRGNG